MITAKVTKPTERLGTVFGFNKGNGETILMTIKEELSFESIGYINEWLKKLCE